MSMRAGVFKCLYMSVIIKVSKYECGYVSLSECIQMLMLVNNVDVCM